MKVMKLKAVTVKYHKRTVLDTLHWKVEEGKITSIIGPNGCGKSTLLKTMAGHIKPERGAVLLQGKPLDQYKRRHLAQQLAMLQQSHDRLPDVTVRTLVEYGRFPHKPVWGTLRKEDEEVVEWALTQTGTILFAERKLSALSGGERQRVWLAMALAQKTRLLLLDEPTTYLDVSHQWEIMELIADMNRKHGITVIMVVHDINHAAAYSDEVLVMSANGVYASGTPKQVLTEKMFGDVFGVKALVHRDANSGRLNCLIKGKLDTEVDMAAKTMVAAN